MLVLMFMWAAVAMQAMQRLVKIGKIEKVEPVAEPVFSFRARGLALACLVIILLGVAIGSIALHRRKEVSPALPTSSQQPSELSKEAAVDLVRDDIESAAKKAGYISSKTDPGEGPREREVFLTTAEALYQKLMLLNVSDPEAGKQRDILADEALTYLNRAKEVEPRRATIWTRLAEIYFLKGDMEKAKEALATVDRLDDVPPLEKRRAQMIHAFIEMRDITRRVRETPREDEKTQLAEQIDRTIEEVETTTRETGADAGSLLTHLHLARAAVTENAGERNRSEDQALNSSLEALNQPASALRTVDRPAALTRPAASSAQSENLVQTATSGSRPPN
ncbi:MAG TPA: tetratricopeptide repeat protein [Thermoanaerobaculia bacterium]